MKILGRNDPFPMMEYSNHLQGSLDYMESLLYEKEGEVGLLTINRPQVLNALNTSVLHELAHFLEETALHENLKVLILTGAGEKAFIAGADIKEMQGLGIHEMEHFCSLGQRVTMLLETAPFMTIAAVHGYALGGGLEMALACDFIYASEQAKLGLPEVTLGIISGFGGTQRLARAVGTRLAKEMIATGKAIIAEEALSIRLVNKVCPPDTLLSECQKTAQQIAEHSATAIAEGKRVVNEGFALEMEQALWVEKVGILACFDTEERVEAMRAFVEKQRT